MCDKQINYSENLSTILLENIPIVTYKLSLQIKIDCAFKPNIHLSKLGISTWTYI